MALTPSTMVSLGNKAPYFKLMDTISDSELSLSDLKSDNATVIMFICNHCPYVKHVQSGLVKLANDYRSKSISFIAINSNDVANYPDDSPQKMKEAADAFGYPFPYLFDETQEVAKAYDAACTPDFFIYDKDLLLTYRGQMDDSRPGNGKPVTGNDIRKVLDDMLEGITVSDKQVPSIGCNIKWKS
ncbi:MAG: thioredoxin family protein [Thermodesulfobacteriota bacterium]